MGLPNALYGRESELNQLKRFLIDQLENPSVDIPGLVVLGDPGMGKTFLIKNATEAIALKHSSVFVQYIKASQNELNTPYALFYRFLNKIENENLNTHINNIIQDIKQYSSDIDSILDESGNAFKYKVIQLAKYIQKQKADGQIIVLDDLQWVDPASLKLFKQMAFANAGSKCVYIFGAREITQENKTWFEYLERSHQLEFLTLSPLNRKAVEKWVDDTCSDAELLKVFIWKKSKGTPYLVDYWLRHFLPQKNTDSDLEDADLIGLQNTDKNIYTQERVNQFLSLAACIGFEFRVSILFKLGAIQERDGWSIAMFCVRNRLIKRVETYYDNATEQVEHVFQFLHDNLYIKYYDMLDASEKAKKHLLIAELIFRKSEFKEFTIFQ